jgi:hypothetical protein
MKGEKNMMKKATELDINYYVKLAKDKVGHIGNLTFETFSRQGEIAGKFEILDFEASEPPHFTFNYWMHERDNTPDGAVLGTYTIKLTETKFYNGKTIKVEVRAYVQDGDGKQNDHLFISTYNLLTGKRLKAYHFPILNWNK